MILRKGNLRFSESGFRFVPEFVSVAFNHLGPFVVASLVPKDLVGDVGGI
jgi:hypothetical protein